MIVGKLFCCFAVWEGSEGRKGEWDKDEEEMWRKWGKKE